MRLLAPMIKEDELRFEANGWSSCEINFHFWKQATGPTACAFADVYFNIFV
jgi:hypothetical protein